MRRQRKGFSNIGRSIVVFCLLAGLAAVLTGNVGASSSDREFGERNGWTDVEYDMEATRLKAAGDPVMQAIILQEACDRFPDNVLLHEKLAGAYTLLRRYDEALEYTNQAIELHKQQHFFELNELEEQRRDLIERVEENKTWWEKLLPDVASNTFATLLALAIVSWPAVVVTRYLTRYHAKNLDRAMDDQNFPLIAKIMEYQYQKNQNKLQGYMQKLLLKFDYELLRDKLIKYIVDVDIETGVLKHLDKAKLHIRR